MWIAIVVVVVLATLYIVLHILNSKIKEPEGCADRRAEMCEVCQMAEKCQSKKTGE